MRFLEDNALVDPPCLSGPGDRRRRALDEHNLYFRVRPKETDHEYLLHVFRAVASLPVAGQLFDERHNPLWSFDPEILSGDAATRLLGLWQRIDPDSGGLAHDFTDPAWDTRFLGDLYQDLSESARKRYALLQTPEFVEEFILDRTLDPAIEEFGFREVRLNRSGLRIGALPARRVSAAGCPLGAARAGHEPARAGQPRSRTGGGRRPESLRRRNRPLPLVRRCVESLRGAASRRRSCLWDARSRWRLPAPRAASWNGRRPAGVPRSGRKGSVGARLPDGRRGGAPLDPRPALSRRGWQPALHHHAEGQGAQPGIPGALWILPSQVLTCRPVHRALLRPRPCARARCSGTGGLRRDDHSELVHEAGVRQEADRGIHPALGSEPRRGHVGRLHPRPRDAHRDPVRTAPPACRRERSRGDGHPRRAGDTG